MNSSSQPYPLSDNEFTLEHIQVGEFGKITAIHADVDLQQRLAALGLRPGCLVQVLRKASFSGPIHLRVGTTEVIMRRSEALRIVTAPLVDLAVGI